MSRIFGKSSKYTKNHFHENLLHMIYILGHRKKKKKKKQVKNLSQEAIKGSDISSFRFSNLPIISSFFF